MNRRLRRPSTLLLMATSMFAVVLTGCTSVASVPVPATASPTATASATSSSGSTPSAQTCTPAEKAQNFLRSYPPATDVAALVASDEALRTIKQRGSLVVGVSADTRLLGARNPQNNQFEGFDIEIAKAIAAEIGVSRIDFRAITTAQRIPYLENGSVDIVARAMTITCDRWKQIAFSTVYFQATQRLLVSSQSKVTDISQLPKGSKICASNGSTSVDLIKQKYTQFTPVEVAANSECLVLFQEGKVDAITSDDAILAGFAAQDPYAQVVGNLQNPQPYGIGVKKENVALVRVVNKVLDDIRADGRWKKYYSGSGLQAALPDTPATPPAPVYGR